MEKKPSAFHFGPQPDSPSSHQHLMQFHAPVVLCLAALSHLSRGMPIHQQSDWRASIASQERFDWSESTRLKEQQSVRCSAHASSSQYQPSTSSVMIVESKPSLNQGEHEHASEQSSDEPSFVFSAYTHPYANTKTLSKRGMLDHPWRTTKDAISRWLLNARWRGGTLLAKELHNDVAPTAI